MTASWGGAMKMSRTIAALALVGLLGLATRDARAQGPFGFGNITGLPYNYFQSQEQLPYYAKFPPVYYSYPVPRTYGYSPFAYPPGVMTPELAVAPEPLDIINPFVSPQPTSAPGPAPTSAPGPSDSLTGGRVIGGWSNSAAASGYNANSASRVGAGQSPRPKMIINPYVSDSVAGAPNAAAAATP